MGMARAERYRLKDGTEKWRGRYFCPDWTWCTPALKAGRNHCKGHVDRLSGFDHAAQVNDRHLRPARLKEHILRPQVKEQIARAVKYLNCVHEVFRDAERTPGAVRYDGMPGEEVLRQADGHAFDRVGGASGQGQAFGAALDRNRVGLSQ